MRGENAMREIKTEAIVLRHANYREMDRMVTLLSPTHGRVAASAYGCRKVGSRLSGCTEWFVCGEYLLTQRKGMPSVAQCQLIESHFGLREQLPRLAHAAYLGRLWEESAQPDEPAPALYGIARAALLLLSDSELPPDLITAVYLLKTSDALGYRPELSACAHCGRALHPAGARMDALRGGLTCRECALPGNIPLHAPSVRLLQSALTSPLNLPPGAAGCSPRDIRAARRAMQRFLDIRLERRPAQNGWLDEIMDQEDEASGVGQTET